MLEQQQILKQTISLSQRQSLEVLAMNNLDRSEEHTSELQSHLT